MLDENQRIYIGNNGEIIKLTNHENIILGLLIENKGKVVTFDAMAEELYRCYADKYIINCIHYKIWVLRKKFKNEFEIYNRIEYGYYII